MKKHIIVGIAAFLAMSGSVLATDNSSSGTPPVVAHSHPMIPAGAPADASSPDFDKDWTLDEARKHAHEKAEREQKYAEKLDKMNEKEWAEHEKKRHAFMDKMKNMTPEERKQYWHDRKEKEHAEHAEATTAPSADQGK